MMMTSRTSSFVMMRSALLLLRALGVDLGDEPLDKTLDLVADGADRIHALAGRVVELPVEVGLAGEVRAGVAAAHGDDVVGSLGCLRCEDLRFLVGDVDPQLGHRGYRGGVDPLSGDGAGGADLDPVARQV